KLIKQVISPCKIAVITDDVVDRIYSETLVESLEKQKYQVVKFVFHSGEASKNMETYTDILNFLALNQLTRTDAIVSLGGGVVGDMAGFCAATYLRGIKYVQVATTLLAQIDSSVGGKTGIDLKEGKNLVGAFYQPSMVICDVNVLSSLPERVFRQGMGEVCKYAILDKEIFEHVENNLADIEKLVYLCVDYKKRIVEEDEFESGNRKLLNLGHTVAHGIEVFSNYKIAHGDAVSMGVKVVINSAYRLKYIDNETRERMLNVISKCSDCVLFKYTVQEVLQAVVYDKKRSGDLISIVMVHGIGDCRVEKIKFSRLMEYFI
ncbi:MAG: 3-dehydroquinate synthase, partial [Clostridia bacterium]|nr:3-dehydroquinate synthase [Clostridia bacterium]